MQRAFTGTRALLIALALSAGWAFAQEPQVAPPVASPVAPPVASPVAPPVPTPATAPMPTPPPVNPTSPAAPAPTAKTPSSPTVPTAPTVPSPLLPTPVAIVTTQGLTLTGAVDLADGKAVIPYGGSVTAGDHASTVTLPKRGNLRICPTTKVNLTADASITAHLPANESPGLMMSLDRGALEANFSTGVNSDVILTPDFRIVISGPGTAAVQVRLGDKGDTCVDNRGPDAPYVSVSSIFDGGIYRVQSDQRVMFQHGSLNEVVDREKESCGCPPEPEATPAVPKHENEFPVAQSEGLAPLPTPAPNAVKKGVIQAQATAKLNYDGTRPGQIQAAVTTPPVYMVPDNTKPEKTKSKPKGGFFRSIGRFFRGFFLG